MPNIKEVRDKESESVPDVAAKRESQRQGAEQRGLDENYTGQLNETQYQDVDIKK